VKPLSESPSGEPASEAAFLSGAARFKTFIHQGRAFLSSNLVNFDQSSAFNELILKWESDVRVRTLRNRLERIAFVSVFVPRMATTHTYSARRPRDWVLCLMHWSKLTILLPSKHT
jgi:hypothetical protein